MAPRRIRSERIDDYDDILDYLENGPMSEAGLAIIEIEMAHPKSSFAKRAAILADPRLGAEFTPDYYRENLQALLGDKVAWEDFPEEMAQLRARRSA